jgi:hypothetical protein
LGLALAAAIFVAALALVCGCTGTGDEGTVTGTGTVTYIDLEGGFYGIVADDGKQYLPQNLDPAFAQDGLSVRFTLKPVDVATIQQWGEPVEVVSIEAF